MDSKELKKEIVDEKTGISYTLVGDYYMPNLYLEPEEKITLNKYGLLRLNYLKKHKKAEYSILFINRELNKHLKEFQEQAQKEINFIIKDLKSKSDLTEDMKNTDMFYWVGTMNSIKAQAEEILAQAQAKAGQIREEAKQEGFNSGTIESERQLTEKKQELEQQHAQLARQLEEDYEQRRNDMEPQIVEALLAVFTEVTHTVSEDNKEIVLHLINNVLKNVENSHSYSIKVSPDDYNFVLNNQGKIYCAMNNEVNLDIVQDMALKQNECMIETDSGVFNCSLDVELHNLIKQIKLLSCM